MEIFVFLGPTLPLPEAQKILDVTYLPPAAQGDIYRVSMKHPYAIGIIDGYFDRVPAVWHKEILWAMKEGIHVFGSSSMGALRAAELEVFGMQGVGKVFQAYQSGEIEDDDEVAIVHGAEEVGYPKFSEPMVNIRFTLHKAKKNFIIDAKVHDSLFAIAKSLYYPDRNYSLILETALKQKLSIDQLNNFENWIKIGRVDQKREDALEMLRILENMLQNKVSPKSVDFTFQHTGLWNELVASAGKIKHSNKDIASTSTDCLIQTLTETEYIDVRRGVIAQLLAIDEAVRHGKRINEEQLHSAIIEFRNKQGLIDRETLNQWIDDNDLTWYEFIVLMEKQAQYRWVEHMMETEITTEIPNYLRLTGHYSRLHSKVNQTGND